MNEKPDELSKIEKSTDSEEKANKKTLRYFLKEWGTPIIAAVIIAIIIHRFLFFNIVVPTGSMIPTIMPHDRIVVTRVHNTEKLKNGDIVVFHSDELKEELIKRLIGIPGDVVERKEDGSVYVNDEKIDEKYVVNDGGPAGKFVVPENSYLFFGDNRANSYDSRRWQQPYISKEDIMGKAQFVIYPFNRVGKLK